MVLQPFERGVFMRGMGDAAAYVRRGMREIICLALFYYTFLAGERLFDVRVSEFVLPDQVVIYESLIVGAGVIGFFCAPHSVLSPPPCYRYDE